MAREIYQEAPEDFHADVVTVGDLVTDRVETVLRALREGDHAANIAARTLYMTESDPALIY